MSPGLPARTGLCCAGITQRQSPQISVDAVSGSVAKLARLKLSTGDSSAPPSIFYFPPAGRPAEEAGGVWSLLSPHGSVLPPLQLFSFSGGRCFPCHGEIATRVPSTASSQRAPAAEGTSHAATREYQSPRKARQAGNPSGGSELTAANRVDGGNGEYASRSALSYGEASGAPAVGQETGVSSSSANPRVSSFTGSPSEEQRLPAHSSGRRTSLGVENRGRSAARGHKMDPAASFSGLLFSSGGGAGLQGTVQTCGGNNNGSLHATDEADEGRGFCQPDLRCHTLSFPYAGEAHLSSMTGPQIYPDYARLSPECSPPEQPHERQPGVAGPWSFGCAFPGHGTWGGQTACAADYQDVTVSGNAEVPGRFRVAGGGDHGESLLDYRGPSGCSHDWPSSSAVDHTVILRPDAPEYQALPQDLHTPLTRPTWERARSGEMTTLQPDDKLALPLSEKAAGTGGPTGRAREADGTAQRHQVVKNTVTDEFTRLGRHTVDGNSSTGCSHGGDAQTSPACRTPAGVSALATPGDEGVPGICNWGNTNASAFSQWGGRSTDRPREKWEHDSRSASAQSAREDCGAGSAGGLCVAKIYFHKKKAAWRTEALIGRSKRQKSFSCKVRQAPRV